MPKFSLKVRRGLCFINALALVCSPFLLPLRAAAQGERESRGKPVVITFGQPNIWSLDQAHYLLSQLRQQSLDFEAAKLSQLDPNETHGTRIDFMRRVFELAAEFRQPLSGASPEPSPTQAEIPASSVPAMDPGKAFNGSVLGTLLGNEDFQRRLFSDPRLNAITKLDNHIQLQYEIIARQLTLLRDEVRPGERLIFLELPQSIYTTDDKADDKLAQVYWQVDGYYAYDAVAELNQAINMAGQRAKNIWDAEPSVRSMSESTCDRETIYKLCRGDDEACNQRRNSCRRYDEYNYWRKSQDDLAKRKDYELTERDRRRVQRLLQEGPAKLSDEQTHDSTKFKPVRASSADPNAITDYRYANVRTVDIIPHQSSLNVNDVQETVKSSVFAGALSFLFGLGVRTNFQRQRDQFSQFLHQELYASGFGKGDSLFGWTFGPLPGTKRVAPGLRTTFAALVVPDVAETISLRARGCFFHREDNQPPSAMELQRDWRWWNTNDRECGETTHYSLSIPSGGGTRNFWVTGIEFKPNKVANQRMVALIKGENFTTQVGVLIDGVPLKHVVELTRKLPLSSRNSNANCPEICGEYEVIGPGDISIAFEMPPNFVGTPEITVIGPGRSVSLNHLPNLRVQAYGQGPGPFWELNGPNTPFMFGAGPQVRIADLKLFKDGATATIGVLLGNNLHQSDEILINGKRLSPVLTYAAFQTGSDVAYFDTAKKLFHLRFAKLDGEKLDLVILDGANSDTKAVANPFVDAKKPPPLAITEDNVLALDMPNGEMAVRLAGTGLAKVQLQVLRGASPESEITSQSATEVILRLVDPKIAVRIKLVDPNTNEDVTRAIVRRPPPRAITEKRDVVDGSKN